MNRTTFHCIWRRAGRSLWTGSLVGAAFLVGHGDAFGQQPVRILRSGRATFDHHGSPWLVEGAKYSGWRQSSQHCTVVSTQSAENAEAGVAQFQTAWSEVQKMAARFQQLDPRRQEWLQRPTTLVYLADTPPRQGETDSFLQHDGQTTVIYVNTSQGLDEQLAWLHTAVAHAYFRATNLDQELPEWVTQGLAQYVSDQVALQQKREPGSNPTDIEAAARVRFLLHGNDARFAASFIQSLRATAEADEGTFAREGNFANPAPSSALDNLLDDSEREYLAWRRDPRVLEPRIVAEDSRPLPSDQQRQIMTVLKLLNRLSIRHFAGIRPRSYQVGSENQESTGVFVAPEKVLAAVLEAQQGHWSTLDHEGRVVFSEDHAAVRQLLGLEEQRFKFFWSDDRWTVVTQQQPATVGWLDSSNPRDAVVRIRQLKADPQDN